MYNTIRNINNKKVEDAEARKLLDTKVDKEEGKGLFSGDYNDLNNKPEIPTATSQLTNDSNFVDKVYLDSVIDQQLLISDTLTSKYATKEEVNNKVDKINGKGLSTNDYSNEEKEKVNTLYGISSTLTESTGKIEETLNNKVDKIEGKGLIDNTEIDRLKDVKNYDDRSIVNSLAALTAQVNELKAQLSNKVDKVEGKELFSGFYDDLYKRPILSFDEDGNLYVTLNGITNKYSSQGAVEPPTESGIFSFKYDASNEAIITGEIGVNYNESTENFIIDNTHVDYYESAEELKIK